VATKSNTKVRRGRGSRSSRDVPTAISMVQVNKTFKSDRGEVVALSDVSLDIKQGEFVTIVGPSGCGKSTVLNIVVGLLEPTSGKKICFGKESKGINPDIGYITQSDNLFPWRTVIENVMFGLQMRGAADPASRMEIARNLISMVGLSGFENHYRHELSGGMRQRVNIIRTLAFEPKMILLDEPFGPLDAQTRLNLQELLVDIRSKRPQTTFCFITHDLSEAIALGDRVVVMSARPGRIKDDILVDLPTPRDVYSVTTHPRFRKIHDKVWSHLAEEMRDRSHD
jgi:NitT/TauT family transport system ATP-binding protein